MAIVNGYTSLEDLKLRLDKIHGDDDSAIEQIITASSRWIDGVCGRSFFSTTETRYFSSEDPHSLDVGDVQSISSIRTDLDGDRVYETVWASGDFELEPLYPEPGWPYSVVFTTPLGQFWFPVSRRGVQITGTWGWAAVPPGIKEATILVATRYYKRRDAPYGIIGTTELGQLQFAPRLDADVMNLLQPFRRFSVGAI